VSVVIRILGSSDLGVLDRVDPGVFDHPVDPDLAAEFLSDSRHHLAVALNDDLVVGMASAVHYVHPDKPPQLWVNEVGVAPGHRAQGIGRRLLEALFARARELGCGEAWVLTDWEKRSGAGSTLRSGDGRIRRTEPCW
jgi:GNAT superfamily N-acetyltransferase